MWLHAGEEEEGGSGELIRHTYVCVVWLRGRQKEENIKRREEEKRERHDSVVVVVGAGAGLPSCRASIFRFLTGFHEGLKTGNNSMGVSIGAGETCI